MFTDSREGKKGGRRGEKGDAERERDQLTTVCSLTRNQTYNSLVHGMVLQPTEPPSQGTISKFWFANLRCPVPNSNNNKKSKVKNVLSVTGKTCQNSAIRRERSGWVKSSGCLKGAGNSVSQRLNFKEFWNSEANNKCSFPVLSFFQSLVKLFWSYPHSKTTSCSMSYLPHWHRGQSNSINQVMPLLCLKWPSGS